jgi:hypothetical protein
MWMRFSMRWISTLGLALLFASGAWAQTVFFDGFDTEPGSGQGASGQSRTNYFGFANWTVSDGTVDLIAHGDFASDVAEVECVGFTGKCVDLDGASNDAGVMTSVPILLDPGIYEFGFELAGTASSFIGPSAAAPNVVDWEVLGTSLSGQEVRNQGDPYSEVGGEFVLVVPTEVQIEIANQGFDNFGAVLDEVWIEYVSDLGPAQRIDIRPDSDVNPVNVKSEGVIPVAILGTYELDVLDVDATTLAFGPGGATPVHMDFGHLADVNEDGLTDLLSHYRTQETGIVLGDTEACVTGELLDGSPFEACDSIATMACGFGFELAFIVPPLMWLHRRRRRR